MISSVKNAKLAISTKRKEGDNMSANVYTISNLLVGKQYISNTLRGEIISAEPHPKPIWYDGCETYLVEVAPNSGYGAWRKSTYRTIAVRKEN